MPALRLGEVARSSDEKYHIESLSLSPPLMRDGEGLGMPLMFFAEKRFGDKANIERDIDELYNQQRMYVGGGGEL